jgi:hypothetical protein
MTSPDPSLSERMSKSYRMLSTAAANLNKVSDELGNSIAELDSSLKSLNLGIASWVCIRFEEYNDQTYYRFELGYDRIASRWGIALRTVRGHELADTEGSVEKWLFNDAPRNLRLEAIDKIPDLIESLAANTIRTAERIAEKIGQARETVRAVSGPPSGAVVPTIAPPPVAETKPRRSSASTPVRYYGQKD